MTDLVQRLQSGQSPLCLEAAREIERTAAMLREAKAEIIRLRDAKRCAMQIADERAKEVVDLRMRLAKELRGRRVDDFAVAPKVYGSLTAQTRAWTLSSTRAAEAQIAWLPEGRKRG